MKKGCLAAQVLYVMYRRSEQHITFGVEHTTSDLSDTELARITESSRSGVWYALQQLKKIGVIESAKYPALAGYRHLLLLHS